MLDYPAIAALAQIIRHGSFEGAAAALNVTPSAISQRIRNLEDRMGRVLVDRGPPVTATLQGLRMAAHLDQVRLLEASLKVPDDPPVIRIAVNADSLASWVMPALTLATGLLDLTVDDQDHAAGWLRSGLVVAALTSEARPVAGCDCLSLGSMRYRAVASPVFAQRHFPEGSTAAALQSAPSISFGVKDMLQIRWAKTLTGLRLTLPQHRIPSAHGFAEAVRLGIGWGMLPDLMASQDIEAGRLIDLSPAQPLDVPLFWQVSRVTAHTVAPLTQAIRKTARDVLHP